MSVHVAILMPAYVELILRGEKTVESRLYQSPKPPMGALNEGELIHIKESGGPFRAVAVASRVHAFTDLNPAMMTQLEERFGPAVCAEAGYWDQRRSARYALFAQLSHVSREPVGPTYPARAYQAWHVVPERASVVSDVVLTAGAIRNHYVPAPRCGFLPATGLTLWLPDGEAVRTTLYRGQRVRWRGWEPYFTGLDAQPGDRVRFTRVKPTEFRVSIVPP